MEIKPVKLITTIKTFQDVQKSLQEVEKVLNELQKSTNPAPEVGMKETDGKAGDLRVTLNTDKTSSLEVKTEQGWKIAAVQKQKVTFIDKEAAIVQTKKQSIDEIESDDISKGTSTANKTIYDEKTDKFVLPRPDYDSGWTADGTSALSHSLGTEAIKLIQVSYNDTENDASSTIYNTNDVGGSSPTAVVVTNGINAITATISNGLNYYRVRLWK